MEKLKPCKKHGTIPRLQEVRREPWQHQDNYTLRLQPEMRYVCDACELEKETARKQPLIDEWNRKQED
jgi:hypothetical protein